MEGHPDGVIIRPLGGRVFIEHVDWDERERVPSGLLLPRQHTDIPNKGRVIAVGPGDLQEDGTRRPPPCEPGDTVLFQEYAGIDVEVRGKKYRILMSSAIIATVDD